MALSIILYMKIDAKTFILHLINFSESPYVSVSRRQLKISLSENISVFILHPGVRIHTVNRIQRTGYREHITENRIKRTGYREQDTKPGYREQCTGNRIHDKCYREQDTENKIQGAENRIQETGYI